MLAFRTQGQKDYALVTGIGFAVGFLALLPFKNIGFTLSAQFIALSVIGFTVFAPAAFFMLTYLDRFMPGLAKFAKFAASGTFSALIYLAILNALIYLSGVSSGAWYTCFAIVAFLISKFSGYSWNKFWTFESKTAINLKEYLHFSAYTISGGVLNVVIASLLVNVIGSPASFGAGAWANFSAVVAIIISSLWTFFSYRYFVFKDKV
jgi:putative flippase GtrA